MFDTDTYEAKMRQAVSHFEDELKKVRTGRAHAGMLDPSNIAAISAAIRANQSLGFNPSDDGRVVRVPVPPLTEERRKQMVKTASHKVEDARIALRTIRQDALKDAKAMKEAKELSEDDLKRVEKEIDRIMADIQAEIDATFKAKEKEILTV